MWRYWFKKKKNCLPMQETQKMWVRSLVREDPLQEEMATLSSILAWKIPWTEELGGRGGTGGGVAGGSHRVRLNCMT